MGRGGRRIVALKGRRGSGRRGRGRRIELEDESLDGSDEEYVVREEGESDSDSVPGEESCDYGSGMSFFGRKESDAEQRNSCWVSGDWTDDDGNKARKGLESEQRGAFAWRRKRSCRKGKVSRVFDSQEGCEREVDNDRDWNVIQEKSRMSFSRRRNLEADRLYGVARVEGNMVLTASQSKPIKKFLGQGNSSAVESQSIRSFLDDKDEDEAEPLAQSKAMNNDDDDKDDDDDDFTADADEHVQNQDEEKKDRKRKWKRRATAYSNSHCTGQISSHVEDMGSEETGDSTTETVGFRKLTTSSRDRLLKRLEADMSWNHPRQKRSVRQSHGVNTVPDHEALKLTADGHVDDVERHWGRKRKRVQRLQSVSTSAVGSSNAIGVENEALTAEQKKRERRKRQIIVYSDSESEDSGSSNTATKGMVLQEDANLSREANGCENFTTRLSSPVSRRLQAGPNWSSFRRKRFRKKGLNKAAAGMQVCGICLSEEHNDIVRGMLDSCSHYFCFTCIMEWSKVESRCPVCKQRFLTITKPARWDVGVCPMKEVITIPERNQVYQPSEEEVRSYFDPYENVVCMECHQGDNAGLLLLCDICDSAAHTYCVGLGFDVPEDSWYCNGCMPSNPRPFGAQALDDVSSSSLHGLCIEHPGNETHAGLESDARPFTASQHPFPIETMSLISREQASTLSERPTRCI